MKWVFLLTLTLTLALGLGLAACGGNDNHGNDNPKDAGAGPGSDASPPMQDAGIDASSPFASCLDRPDQADSMVPHPPTGGLPCDLIPPAALH